MKIYENLEQGTQAWLDARAGVLTASSVGKLITAKTLKASHSETARAVMHQLIAERLAGRVEPIVPSKAMERGTLDEPIAREAYTAHTGNTVREVGFITKEFGENTLGYSPDGLVGNDGLIEIKSRSNKIHLKTILEDAPPAENMAQLQTGLLVTGRAWIDYVSFSAGMPLYITRVLPDQKWQTAILDALKTYSDLARTVEKTYIERTQNMPVMDVPFHYFDDFELEVSF